MTFKLAACAEMIYQDLPFEERVKTISDQGFLVEIWDWSTKDIDALVATGAEFSSMTGYLRGDLITEQGQGGALGNRFGVLGGGGKAQLPPAESAWNWPWTAGTTCYSH